jgi:DNA-binding PadR family transcriptional regulator
MTVMGRRRAAAIKRALFLAFIRIHLLHHAGKEPIYGLEMIQELAHHGKVRTYYTLTEEGAVLLGEIKPKIAELVHEIIEEH